MFNINVNAVQLATFFIIETETLIFGPGLFFLCFCFFLCETFLFPLFCEVCI